MGISYETYVGPYVRCEVAMVDVEKTKRACVNTTCKRYGKDGHGQNEFCAACGSPIGDIPYTEQKDAVDKWEMSEAIDERLHAPGGDGYYRWSKANHTHLWIPNIKTPWRDGALESQEDFSLSEIQATDIKVETEQFTLFFANELALFWARYGVNAVSIHWGIIQHYY